MSRRKKQDVESREYWNRLLVKKGLAMDRGRDPRLVYVGSGVDLETLEGALRVSSGRTLIEMEDEENRVS